MLETNPVIYTSNSQYHITKNNGEIKENPNDENDTEKIINIKNQLNNNYISENKKKNRTITNSIIIKDKDKKINIRNYFSKMLIILLIVLIITGIILIIIKKTKGKKNNKPSNSDIIKGNNGEILICKLKIEKDICLIFNESISTKTIIEVDKSSKDEDSTIESTSNPLIHNYLINIYDQKEMYDKSILYYGYVLLLREYMIIGEDFIEYIGGNNIFNSSEFEDAKTYRNLKIEKYINKNKSNNSDSLNNNDNNYDSLINNLEILNLSPLVKFSFFENGTMNQILKPKLIDDSMYSNIENFIWKSIPSVSENLYSKSSDSKRLLEEKRIVREYSKDKNSKSINLKESELTEISFINDSKIISDTEVKINQDGIITEIKGYAISEIVTNINNENEKDSSDDFSIQSDFDEEDNNKINGPTKKIKNIIETIMHIKNNTINETVKETIENIIKDENIEFENVYLFNGNLNDISRRRRTKKINNNIFDKKVFTGNLNDFPDISTLRNLDIDSYSIPIKFSYSIFKSDLGGVKFGMSALVTFYPQNLTSYIIILFNTNNENRILFEKEESSNITNAFPLMKNIIIEVSKYLIRLVNSIKNKSNTWVNIINKEFKQITDNLKKFDDISNVFVEPLNEIIQKTKKVSQISFDNMHKKINESETKLNQLNNNIYSNVESNNNQINEETKNDFNNYIEEMNNSIRTLHNYIITFIDGIKQKLSAFNEKTLDISIYYSIIEEIELCSNVYSLLDNININNAILKEKGDFNLYIDEIFNLEIEEILDKFEIISKRLQFNETLKECIKENNRKDMINKLNTFRIKISNIISNIQKNINSTYSKILNELSLTIITNYKNEFITKKDELINQLNIIVKESNNFFSHTRDLESINTINNNIFKKRKELFYENIIKNIQNIQNSYLTENKLKLFDSEISNISKGIINEILSNKENNFPNLINLVDELFSKIIDIDTNYMSDNLYLNIFGLFNNTNLINSMYEKYYQELKKEFDELNYTFFQKIYLSDFENYITEPDEVKFLLNQMFETQLTQKNIINSKVTSLIYTYINLMISYSYHNFINIIHKNIEYINKSIPNNILNDNTLTNLNYYKTKSNEIIELENSQFQKLINVSNQSYNSNTDPLNILSLTTENENVFSRLILEIKLIVDIKFSVKNDKNIGKPLPELSNNTKENYLNAITRHGVNILKSIYLNSQNIISYDSIKGISSNDYINEFILNYNKEQIIYEIQSYLNNISYEGLSIINPNLEINKNNIKNIFSININDEISNGKLKQLIDQIFVIDDTLKKKTNIIRQNLNNKIESLFLNEKKVEESYYFDVEKITITSNEYYKLLESNLEENNQKIINQIQYNSNFQKPIYDYYIKDQEKFVNYLINIISEITKIYSNFSILNDTLNYQKISLEQVNFTVKTFRDNFSKNSEMILQNAYSDFSNKIIKTLLDEHKDKILRQYNESYEIYYYYMIKNSEIEPNELIQNISSFSNELNNTFINYLNNYLNDMTLSLSSNYFNEFLSNGRDENLNILDTKNYNIGDLENDLIENGNKLKTLCNERYQREKNLLTDEIYLMIENIYKNNINNFINSYGKIYFDKVYNEIFTERILYQLDFTKNQFISNNEFMNNYIQKINKVQDLIYSSLEKSYEDIKKDFTNNLITNLKNIFYTEIDRFNIESSENISNFFLEETTKILNSDIIKNTFNPNIIEFIPKSFSEGFYKKMKNDYLDIQKENIENFKTKCLNEISKKGNETETLINNMKTATYKLIKNKILKTNDKDILDMESLIDEFINNKSSINEEIDNIFINTSDNKKTSLQNLFSNTIKNKLNEIISIYDNSQNEIQQISNDDIDSFKDYSIDVIKDLNIESIIQKTENSYSIIEKTRNEIKSYILDIVNTYSDLIENQFKKDFEKINNQNENRRLITSNNLKNNRKLEEKDELKETNIQIIKEIFPNIEKVLNELSNKISLGNEYINFNSEKNIFTSKVNNIIEHIKDPIVSSLTILKDYLTNEQYISFEEKLNNQSNKIIQELQKLLEEQSKEFSKITNLINNDYPSNYSEIYILIKVIIDTILLTYFDKIFKKMKKIEFSDKKDIKNGYVISELSENMFGTVISFKNQAISYGYSHKMNVNYNNYKMNIKLEAGGYSDIDALYQNGNYKYIINGRLGDSLIGFNAIEDFTSQKTELIGYIQQNEFAYNKQIQEYVRTGRRLLHRALCSSDSDTPTYAWKVTKENKIKKSQMLKEILKYY